MFTFGPASRGSSLQISLAVLERQAGPVGTYGDVAGNTYSFSPGSSSWGAAWVRSASVRTGKRYFEVLNVGPAAVNFFAGVTAQGNWTPSFYPANQLTAGVYGAHYGTVGGLVTGFINNGVNSANASSIWLAGERCGVAIDFATGKIWFARNNTWLLSGNPAAGTSPNLTFAATGAFDPIVSFYQLGGSSQVLTCAFNEADWFYAPPSGFLVL